MADIFNSLPKEVVAQERIKGAVMSVYFRWLLIAIIGITLSIQLISGYNTQSTHSIIIAVAYLLLNIGLWLAARQKYDPLYLAYFSASMDVMLITLNLYFSSLYYDKIAISAAASMLLYPILFVLYTFRLNRPLLIFMVIFSVISLNISYFYLYFQNSDYFLQSLSTSPISHIFKSIYLLFTGFLCVYLQHSISAFIQKQIAETNNRAELDLKIKMEEQKNKYAQRLIDQEKEQNKKLEREVKQRTNELTHTKVQLINLQKENLQSQYDVLKQQVNPHFLFNSLNVLTSLIKLEPDLAEKFSEQLSKVYRYILENKDNELVDLDTELNFLDAYIFLLNIRFVGKLQVLLNIPNENRNDLIIPLAMQLLIENAIKHNMMSKSRPLTIHIFIDKDNSLNVINNLQERSSQIISTGVGLKNIMNRYQLLNLPAPVFEKTEDRFIARIRLVKNVANS
jgi:sensor histidine kinase YesM